MFDLIGDIIGYTGSQYNNVDQYILYCCVFLIDIFGATFIDFFWKLIKAVLPRRL